jgi:hypothetical protein
LNQSFKSRIKGATGHSSTSFFIGAQYKTALPEQGRAVVSTYPLRFILASQVLKARVWPAHKARSAEVVLLDDGKRLAGFALLITKVEHPVASIHDLPAPIDTLYLDGIRIEDDAVLPVEAAGRCIARNQHVLE